ncbi:prepilin-type N-terminal cleavage/methylation domain-containing protein [Polaribacter cellanae]|uniref:Prepilin-type N-terminal cleavage/methylation domain-containing protein n=1 Tax=Polaribacter cellanae TaxID=2818493 RepID=A0A975H5P3_9FLAO|nr:prepilin-type N-terminal cleavage/methylation domain-containing protein [Polaribacter cellanae]QTE21148.1 prepilin-type N-terminal cleavage/methylation domain-containing protein [Polaribacter cellanae]
MKVTKLKAFTLAEMLVVLVVSSIVISMAFLILNMVRKQVKLIQANYQKKQEIQFFETRFSRDFNSYNAFFRNKENKLILKDTKDSITYTFSDNLIIREKDTFFLKIENKKLFLNGLLVENKFIDGIEIQFSEEFANKTIFIQQNKDATFYLNN